MTPNVLYTPNSHVVCKTLTIIRHQSFYHSLWASILDGLEKNFHHMQVHLLCPILPMLLLFLLTVSNIYICIIYSILVGIYALYGTEFWVRGCDMARGEAEGHITSEDPKRGPIYTAYIPTSMLYNIYFLHVTSFQLPVAPIKKFPFRLNVTLAQNRCLNVRCIYTQ